MHVFSAKAREYYDLERLWREAKEVEIPRRVKIFLYFIGKPKDPHANALAADYIKRAAATHLRKWLRSGPERSRSLVETSDARRRFCSTPPGKSLDSDALSPILFAKAEMQGHDLVFVVGGHDGLPAGWRERADLLLSLSAMTMPHELARAVLAEQIYRAFTILRGHPVPALA